VAAGDSSAGRSPPVLGSGGSREAGVRAAVRRWDGIAARRGGRQPNLSRTCVAELRRDGSFLQSHGDATHDAQ
jgi:hypothetical protein